MIRGQTYDGRILVIDHRGRHFYISSQLPLDTRIGALKSAWLYLPSDHSADVSRRVAIGAKAFQRLGLISLGETITLLIR